MVCDGVLQVTIGVPRECRHLHNVPFLPIRLASNQKTYRALCKACLLEFRKGAPCDHSFQQRSFRETYSCSEVAYSVTQLKYECVEIHEAMVWTDLQPIFQDYIKLCAKTKARFEKLPSRFQGNVQAFCDEVNSGLNLVEDYEKLYPWEVTPNESMRAYIKGT